MICFGLIVMVCQAQAQLPPAQSAASFCAVAKPIYWAAADTRQTKEQVDEHNSVWKRLCSKAKK